MIINVYAIHDSKAHSYLQPFFMHNDDLAIRSFTDASMNTESQFNQHPLDYTLFHIGTYDDETSIITAVAPPNMLITSALAITKANETIKAMARLSIDKETNNEK